MQTTNALALTWSDPVRLLPHLAVVRRDDREIQLGYDSDDATVLADPEGSLTVLLEAMDGRYRLGELSNLASRLGVSNAELDALLTALAANGLLQPSGAIDFFDRTIRVVGLGPAGTRIAQHLLSAGIGRLLIVDPERQVPSTPWTNDRDRVQRIEHWSQPRIDEADLTVIVPERLEIDRAISSSLAQADHPHLIVRPRGQGAVVGPLVIPGQTSCLRCADLARTRTDPAWPRMLAQLCRIATPWQPLAADWAAAMAATQVLGHLTGRLVETAAATLELGPANWQWQRRVWPADPACGCTWSPG